MRKSSVLHPNLRVVVLDGNDRQAWDPPGNVSTNCHFVGKVTSSPSDRQDDASEETQTDADSRAQNVSGLAVLSACQPTIGFVRHVNLSVVLQTMVNSQIYEK